jgi:hypothetical protein
MGTSEKSPVVNTREEYQQAVRRAAELRESGASAETDEELAALEGAIARYVAKPGEPARRSGRPRESGNGM